MRRHSITEQCAELLPRMMRVQISLPLPIPYIVDQGGRVILIDRYALLLQALRETGGIEAGGKVVEQRNQLFRFNETGGERLPVLALDSVRGRLAYFRMKHCPKLILPLPSISRRAVILRAYPLSRH